MPNVKPADRQCPVIRDLGAAGQSPDLGSPCWLWSWLARRLRAPPAGHRARSPLFAPTGWAVGRVPGWGRGWSLLVWSGWPFVRQDGLLVPHG